jgi:glycosyltransferase involved in cell wall biosynthesis
MLPSDRSPAGLEPDAATGSVASEAWIATLGPNERASGRSSRFGLGGRWSESTRQTIDRFKQLVAHIPASDLVHIECHSAAQTVSEALPSLVLARFFGKKVVLQFTSADIERLLESRRKWLMPFLKMADRLVVGSRYLQKVFNRAGLNATVLARPLLLGRLEHRTIKRVQPRILVNCPLEADFNVAGAIKGFRLLKQKYPRSELLIVGSGGKRACLERIVDDLSISGVEFMGELKPREEDELYHECDLYLHPAVVDESPTGLVKAFAAGLPVVAADADGLLHMVRNGFSGLLVAVGDHVGLADSMIELVENNELTEKLSLQGKIEARKHTWSRLRQDWVNLYATIAV